MHAQGSMMHAEGVHDACRPDYDGSRGSMGHHCAQSLVPVVFTAFAVGCFVAMFIVPVPVPVTMAVAILTSCKAGQHVHSLYWRR